MPRESCFRRSPHDWQDHVNDAAGGLPDGAERVVANALEFAQVVVERTIEPLIDLVSGLSENSASSSGRAPGRTTARPTRASS